MSAWVLLLQNTLLSAGYNLVVKASGGHAAGTVTTAILAKIRLQTEALAVSGFRQCRNLVSLLVGKLRIAPQWTPLSCRIEKAKRLPRLIRCSSNSVALGS